MMLRTSSFFLAGLIGIVAACSGSVPGSSGTGGGSSGSGAGGGTGSTSSTGSGMAAPCASSADCTLHADCCNCLALGPGEQPPACDLQTCLTDACTAAGGVMPTDAALCSGGQCIVGFDCNGSDVLCNSPPPSCPPGQVPTAGTCWGQCVDVVQCGAVTSCADCDAATQVCVSYVGGLGAKRCIEVPPECAQDRSCGCLGATVCTEGFNLCADGTAPDEVSCECPTC